MKREGNTKERILTEAMTLFSVYGYEAVSVRAIADAVGVGNSALYKHYKSKQEILDAIVERCRKHFLEKSKEIAKLQSYEIRNLEQFCLEMFLFQTTDMWMVTFRKILLMEQFKNPELAALYKSCFIELPVNSMEKIFEKLVEMGVMKKKNCRVLAMELYAPFFLYHLAADNTEELMPLFRCHVNYFFEENFKEKQMGDEK